MAKGNPYAKGRPVLPAEQKRTNAAIKFNKEERDLLKTLAIRTGLSQSNLVIRLIRQELEKYK